MRLPDGSPAADVPVNIRMSPSLQRRATTNQEGAAFDVLNVDSAADVTVEVCISLDTAQANHSHLCTNAEIPRATCMWFKYVKRTRLNCSMTSLPSGVCRGCSGEQSDPTCIVSGGQLPSHQYRQQDLLCGWNNDHRLQHRRCPSIRIHLPHGNAWARVKKKHKKKHKKAQKQNVGFFFCFF